MRRIVMILLAVVALVFFSGKTEAMQYTVKRGDTLRGIAKTFTGKTSNFGMLANANLIDDADRIYADQKLEIPDAVIVKAKVSAKKTVVSRRTAHSGSLEDPKVYTDKGVGADPFKGTPEQGLRLLGLMAKGEKLLSIKHLEGDEGFSHIANGDQIKMVSGSKGHLKVAYFIVKFEKPYRAIVTKVYEFEIMEKDGQTIRKGKVELNIWCDNWLIKIISPPPPEEVPPPPPPKEPEIPPPAPPEVKEDFPEPPVVPEAPGVAELPEAEKPCCPPEHEPIIGLGTWGNGIAEGDFAYGEYLLWLKKPIFRCDSEYAWGIGVYGNWEQGESKISSYDWDGYAVGPQAGLKYTGVYFDEKDKKYRLKQSVTKLRLVFEETDGSNNEGYKMHQDSLKLGLYSEYVRELTDSWTGILVGEGWLGLDSSIKSTWAGDSPSRRGQVGVAAYAQYKVSDDWAVRFGGGPFWQQWDDMYGVHLRAEARWKNTIMFGPYANLFPFGKSSTYRGIPLSDLQTWGAFIRIEFGDLIREADRKRRMERVKAADEERFGTIQM